MVISIVAAHLWGVFQLILLGSFARTVRVRTAYAALGVGLYVCAPAAGGRGAGRRRCGLGRLACDYFVTQPQVRNDTPAHAGKYELPHTGSLCFHSKSRRVYSAVWEGSDVHDASVIGQAAVEIVNPDVPGAKVGSVRISFGDTANHPTVYEVTAKPVNLTVSGRNAEIAFDGRTSAGIVLNVAVSCRGTDEM